MGDYTADTDFYVPGVNEPDPPTSVTPDVAPRPSRVASARPSHSPVHHISSSRTRAASVSAPRRSSRPRVGHRISPSPSSSLRVGGPAMGVVDDADDDDDDDDDDVRSRRTRETIGDSDDASVGDVRRTRDLRDDDDDDDDDVQLPEGDDDDDDDDDDFGDFDDDGPIGVVRQHSNFSRLSAQSWLTVDSAQDVDVEEDIDDSTPSAPSSSAVRPTHAVPNTTPASTATSAAPPTIIVEGDGGPNNIPMSSGPVQMPIRGRLGVSRDAPLLFDRKYSGVADHDPSTLFGVDVNADVMDNIQAKAVRAMSVFECCAVLQAGVAAYKKKSFRRYGARRVWLSPECDKLFWTSKKDGVFTDQVKLQKVAKMKCAEREVSIDITEGYRISLIFATPDEAGMWVRALSCLIPLQARVREPRGIIPPDKEREDYNLSDDAFNGLPLREYMAVNSYVVLCAAKGQPQSLGNKLAFSRSDGSFCGMRYIPHKIVPLMLRSQEEIAVLKRLSHPNVVKYHECLLDTDRGGNYVIFEHLARGSLIDSSRLEGVRPVPESAARELIRDVVNALEYLHTLRIAHGDVRPDNLLRAVNGAVKLNPLGCITHDFTEIKNVPALVKARLGDASPAFLAPELCWLADNPPKAHAKSYAMDVWAVGVVLYFVLYGRVPFGGRDDAHIQQSICTGKLRFPRQPETSRKVRSLLKGVLGEKDPKTRIPLSELKSHPWFTESEVGIMDPPGATSLNATRLIVSPAEVDSAVQMAKVRVTSKRQ